MLNPNNNQVDIIFRTGNVGETGHTASHTADHEADHEASRKTGKKLGCLEQGIQTPMAQGQSTDINDQVDSDQ